MEHEKASSATVFPKKLINGRSHHHSRSFSGKSMYDGVFSALGMKRSGVIEDYGEIFGGSTSSIPILEVPELNERKTPVDARSSKLDYSNVFGGFDELDFAVSHEELLPKSKKTDTVPVKEAWHPAEARLPAEDLPSKVPMKSQGPSHEACNQSVDSMKQFKMSYHRTNQGSRKGENGTTHIAQLHAIPGYTCLVDDFSSVHKTEGNPPVSSVDNNACSTGVTNGKPCKRGEKLIPPCSANKQRSEEFQYEFNQNSCNFNGMPSDVHEIHFNTYNSKLNPSPALPHKFGSNKFGPDRPMASMFGVRKSYSFGDANGMCSPPYFDEEANANSVAATSAAAVKHAIEEAQAKIKFVKELMERKKEGLQSRAKQGCHDGLKAEDRRERKMKGRENKLRENGIQGIWERVDSSTQALPGVDKQYTMKADKSALGLRGEMEKKGEKEAFFECPETFESTSKPSLVDNKHEVTKILEVAKQGDNPKKMMESVNNDHSPEKKNADSMKYENPDEYSNKVKAVVGVTQEEFERKHDAVERADEGKEWPEMLKSTDGGLVQQENKDMVPSYQHSWNETEESHSVSPEKYACEKNPEGILQPTKIEIKLEMREPMNGETLTMSTGTQGCVQKEENQAKVVRIEENGCILESIDNGKENDLGIHETSVAKDFAESCERSREKEVSRLKQNKEEPEVICNGEDAEKHTDEMKEVETVEVRKNNRQDSKEDDKRFEMECSLGGNVRDMQAKEDSTIIEETSISRENEKIHIDSFEWVESGSMETQKESFEWVVTETMEAQIDQKAEPEKAEAPKEIPKYREDANEASTATCEEEEFSGSVEITEEVHVHEENMVVINEATISPECDLTREKIKVAEVTNEQEENEAFETTGLTHEDFEIIYNKKQVKNTTGGLIDNHETDLNSSEQKQYDSQPDEFRFFYNMGKQEEELSCESGESYMDADEPELVGKQEETENNCRYPPEGRWFENYEDREPAQPPNVLKEETEEAFQNIETTQSMENDEEIQHETIREEDSEAKDTSPREIEPDKEHVNKIDKAKEREREREKERIVVERAIKEARERAFAEARRRVMATSKELNDKASVDKASLEAKLKAQRAAVERATTEARERALEKALSEKNVSRVRNQAEKFSGPFRDNGMKSFSSHDSQSKPSIPSRSSSFPNPSNHGVASPTNGSDEANGESAQRCKARLERHQRTAERAANALAEKNMRDVLAQKEQTERNRLAKTLDADVKRWSSGKIGNLRALLSTLQYVLGPESGWQSVPLTDLITSTAVRKAYRKATLYVHPDKLQQRGATIQQKYICEKVFDLLKDAWNKFSSEER